MSRQIIAVDIDEVLLPHFQDLIAWYNNLYGTKLTLAHNHPTDPRPWGTTSVTEAVQRVQKFFETPRFKEAKPFNEAITVLKSLNRKYDLLVVTARDTIIEDVTRSWLERHFPKLFKEAHFTARYSLSGEMRSKAKVTKQLRADYLIDDDLNHAITAADLGITVLLFGDYPWNQTKKALPVGVSRVKGWLEVEEYFDGRP